MYCLHFLRPFGLELGLRSGLGSACWFYFFCIRFVILRLVLFPFISKVILFLFQPERQEESPYIFILLLQLDARGYLVFVQFKCDGHGIVAEGGYEFHSYCLLELLCNRGLDCGIFGFWTAVTLMC